MNSGWVSLKIIYNINIISLRVKCIVGGFFFFFRFITRRDNVQRVGFFFLNLSINLFFCFRCSGFGFFLVRMWVCYHAYAKLEFALWLLLRDFFPLVVSFFCVVHIVGDEG